MTYSPKRGLLTVLVLSVQIRFWLQKICCPRKFYSRKCWSKIIHLLKVRCVSKKWNLFYDQYLHQTKHKSAGYIFNLKGWIHSSLWSTKAFLYHIREPRYQQKNIGYKISRPWDKEQSLNLTPPRFMHNFSSYEHFRKLGHGPF